MGKILKVYLKNMIKNLHLKQYYS